MPSDNESDTNVVSEGEFVARSGDEEVLWQVEEITAERGRKYKVKWAGIDPDTGKSWAQSWVPKYDCTNDLVREWKAKKRLQAGRKRGRRTSTSRTSGSSKRTGSSTSEVKTRRSTSNTTSSRLDSVEEHVSQPAKPTTTKRKQQPNTSSSAAQNNEQSESPRPHKKRKTMMVEVLLPPKLSEGTLEPHAEVTVQDKVPSKSNRASLDDSDGGDSSPPNAKSESERRADAGTKSTAVTSKGFDIRVPQSKTDTRVIPQRKNRVTKTATLPIEDEDEDEELRPPRSKTKSMAERNPTLKWNDGLSDKGAEPAVHPVKIGPPRGVKRRRKTAKKSGSSSKPGSSRMQHGDDPADGHVLIEDSGYEILSLDNPQPLQQNMCGNRISPPRHLSIPQVLPSARPRSPDLSPGAKARLELFDRMVMHLPRSDIAPSPPHVSEKVPDGTYFNDDDTYEAHDAHDTFDPPLLTSSPLKLVPIPPKLDTPNGLVVPETESSGISQDPSQSLLEPPRPLPPPSLARDKSPCNPLDLPVIAVIPVSAPSSTSPQELLPPKGLPLFLNRPSKKPTSTSKLTFSTSHSMVNARSRVADEAPPSSIESFTSPRRPDKGKERAIEDDHQTSLSEEEGDQFETRRAQREITDSGLKKRGKELFNEAQRVREVEWRKNRKGRQLKTIDEIVNGMNASTPNPSPFSFTNGLDSAPELRLEDVMDLSGGANSMTLDTPEQSETKPLSEEAKQRLRIELRQEEEESTQEAMGIYLLPSEEERQRLRIELRQEEEESAQETMAIYSSPPTKESKIVNGVDARMLPPVLLSSKDSPFAGQIENVSHAEQPSTDINQASVIVQASQEHGHEDMDTEPLQTRPPASSPPCPIPENLTDSPSRRLGEALSLLNLKSEEIQRLQRELADAHKDLQELKVELSELQQSSEPTGPVRAAWDAERAQWTQERAKWESNFSLWEAQLEEMSEEKANLTTRLAELSDAAARSEEARARLSELEAERVSWTKERDVMLNDVAQRTEELAVATKVRGEHDQDRLNWGEESTLWAEERARWEIERTALQEKQENLLRSVEGLTTSVDSLKAAKVSAEKDREFFREQYVQASDFVDSVRKENVELEKRVTIAEGQAREGVAAIKALFEDQVKALQADVERWKGLTELLQEKDRRTNDELRLRAAQVPELKDLRDHLRTENKSLEVNLRRLGQAHQRTVFQRNRLYYQILLLKRERTSLKFKLSKLTKVDINTSIQETSLSVPALPVVDDPEDMDPNDVEPLPDPIPQSLGSTFDEPAWFPCMWRPQWRDQCQQIFDSKEDLERHMQDHFRDLLAQ